MCYLHGEGVIHKDLKPENILVDNDFHIKIADLGVASFKTWSKLTKEEHNEQRKVNSTRKKTGGTLCYMAPEHLNDVNAKPTEKSDVYSFAIVLWAVLANKEPYENAICEQQLILCIKSGNRPDVDDVAEDCPGELIRLMELCWEADPRARPTFPEAVSGAECSREENAVSPAGLCASASEQVEFSHGTAQLPAQFPGLHDGSSGGVLFLCLP